MPFDQAAKALDRRSSAERPRVCSRSLIAAPIPSPGIGATAMRGLRRCIGGWWSRSNSRAAASIRSPDALRSTSPAPGRNRSEIRLAAPRSRRGGAVSPAHSGWPAARALRSRRSADCRGARPRSGPARSRRSGPPVAATMVDSMPRSVGPAVDDQRDPAAEALEHMLGAGRADRPLALAEGAARGRPAARSRACIARMGGHAERDGRQARGNERGDAAHRPAAAPPASTGPANAPGSSTRLGR